MKTIRLTLGMLLLTALFASASNAQVQRTFVSGFGSDSNPCTLTAPCRTFAQAISQTSAGGEVYAVDSAGYGAFTISQAISIVAAPGVSAGISVFSGDGIDINAGSSDTIILRGLTINSQGGGGGAGIRFNSGGILHVESCVVNGFLKGFGICFGGAGRLEVKDSIMRGNSDGIFVNPLSGTAVATIDQVRLEGTGNNGNGLLVESGAQVTVRSSVASANGVGFHAQGNNSAAADLYIESCVASNNNDGIAAQSFSTGVATARVSGSTVTNNSRVGLNNNGSPAVLLSRGNNTVEGNATDTMGTIGSYSAK